MTTLPTSGCNFNLILKTLQPLLWCLRFQSVFCVNERIKFVQMVVNISREFATPSSSLSTIRPKEKERFTIKSSRTEASSGCNRMTVFE